MRKIVFIRLKGISIQLSFVYYFYHPRHTSIQVRGYSSGSSKLYHLPRQSTASFLTDRFGSSSTGMSLVKTLRL